MSLAVSLIGGILLYGVIATAYGQFCYLRFRHHPEYMNFIPPASILGSFWPITVPGHFAIWLGTLLHNKTKKV